MKLVRIREVDPSGRGRDFYPETDHDATVNGLVASGWDVVWDGTWDTDLKRDAYRVTVTTVRR